MGDGVFIMSDYGAVGDAFSPHHYCATADECTASVLAAGVDQDGGGTDFARVGDLIAAGLLSEAQVRRAATRLFTARMSLGLLNPPQSVPYAHLDAPSTLDSPAHRQLSLEAAQQGIVLLTNPHGALPLNPSKLRKVAVIGPNADAPDTLYGNYAGTPPYLITPRMGLVAALPGGDAAVYYAPGCANVACANTSGFPAAVTAASHPDADAVILVLGLDQTQEAEGHDRTNITLPGLQTELAQAVCAAASSRSVPCIVVYITGGPLADAWSQANADAVLLLGYASQSAGTALVDVLFGAVPPAGKLAVTWPASVADLPPFGDMGMRPNATSGGQGRTYRFAQPPPLYPFGHGLSYTSWAATDLVLPPSPLAPCAGVPLAFTLTNTGGVASGQVVQVYVSWGAGGGAAGGYAPPTRSLAEFERVYVSSGGSVRVSLTLPPRAFALVNASAAETFGGDFALSDPGAQEEVRSGRAFGLGVDYSAGGAIGWDDLFLIPTGAPVTLFIGSGQPGDSTVPGMTTTVTFEEGEVGGAVNLATCA